MKTGFPIAFPLITALFSIKVAIGIVAIELLSWMLGTLIIEYEYWHYYRKREEGEKEPPKSTKKLSELEQIVNRLEVLHQKYGLRTETVVLLLHDNTIIPKMDNLDWLELVGLVNQLSLYVGKNFTSGKKGEKE